MQVLKFGGTSVANSENINKVIAIIQKAAQQDKTIVVVSALGGVTDVLLQSGGLAAAGDESYKELLQKVELRHLEAVKALIPVTQQSSVLSWVKQRCNEIEDICNGVFLLGELSARTKDKILSFGELLSSRILSMRLETLGMTNIWADIQQLIVTDSAFGNAAVNFSETNIKCKNYFTNEEITTFIVPGFIASDAHGNTTTLGRGGSDYTAAIIAGAVSAQSLEIWTDVSGMMTADPRLVKQAKVLPCISYQEAMELSHFGAKVIYPPTIQPVMSKNIPVWIKNTFAPEDYGTVIKNDVHKNENYVCGISSINKIALLSLEGSGMVGIPGFSRRLFESLASDSINVILITQGSSEHSICVGIDEAASVKAKETIDKAFAHEIASGTIDPLIIEKDLAVVALVGDNMKNHPGISGKMFGAIGRNGINVRVIAQGSSERNISAVIAAADVKKAINVLHEEFFETTSKQINLFVAGTGNVGSRLLAQLDQQKDYLQRHLRLQIRVVGIANSKKMIFSDEGIELDSWRESLQQGETMNLVKFMETVRSKNLRNSVFVDITANADIAACYEQLLQKAIAVVACNKIACSELAQK